MLSFTCHYMSYYLKECRCWYQSGLTCCSPMWSIHCPPEQSKSTICEQIFENNYKEDQQFNPCLALISLHANYLTILDAFGNKLFIYNDNNVPIHQKKAMRGLNLQQASKSVGKGQNGQSKAAGSGAQEWEQRRRSEWVSGCDMGQRVRSSALCGFVVIEFIS